MTSSSTPPRLLALALAVALPCLAVCTGRGPSAGAQQDSAAPTTTPRLRLRLSGGLEGKLEPCGCASGQLGGLPRRAFYLQQDPTYDLLLEGGNTVKDGSPLELEKLATALAALDLRGYAALGLGPRDLLLPLDDLAGYLSMYRLTPLASDLVEKAPAAEPGARFPHQAFRDHDGPARARIAALTLELPEGPARERFTLLPPDQAWQKAMADCPSDRLRLLIVHGLAEQVRAAARYTPTPDLVIGVSEAFSDPPHEAENVGAVPVVFTGTRGRMLLDLTLTRTAAGAAQVTRYQVIPLEGSKSAPGAREDRETRALLLQHRQVVKEMGLREALADRKPDPQGRTYVGNAACADCHEDAMRIWQKTKHGKAWETLVKAEQGTKYGWPVTNYPDCVGCHVVGYGNKSGFVSPEKTAHLADVGCEECHGPGSAHVDARVNDKPAAQGTPGWLGDVSVQTCMRCHDAEQSPGFVYGERWKAIEHR